MRLLLILLFLASGGCSSTADGYCRSLQNSGQMYATIDSCKKCVRQLGRAEPALIQGCAMGMDAGSLLSQ